MEEAPAYREEFYNSLDSAKASFDLGLARLIRILESPSVPEKEKRALCGKAAAIGGETSAFLSSIKFGEISRLNVREYEARIEGKLAEASSAMAAFVAEADRTLAPGAGSGEGLSIDDIVAKLGSSRIGGGYALTKERIDGLLAIRRFIVAFYESMTGKAESEERKLDKDFYELRLKTFLGSLRGPGNRNPDFAFLALSLFRKLAQDGTKVTIADPGVEPPAKDELFLSSGGEGRLRIARSFEGSDLRCSVAKSAQGEAWRYRVEGSLGARGEKVEFLVDESVGRSASDSFEHILGLDFVRAQYDKAFLATSRAYAELRDREESRSRESVQDAAFDLLFRPRHP